jgi:hypothetical protein
VEPAKKVEIEPKVVLEKGPLFLTPAQVQNVTGSTEEPSNREQKPESADKPQAPAATRDNSKTLVRGPTQAQASTTAKPAEQKPTAPGQEDEKKGVFDQIRQDLDSLSKALNPFRW